MHIAHQAEAGCAVVISIYRKLTISENESL